VPNIGAVAPGHRRHRVHLGYRGDREGREGDGRVQVGEVLAEPGAGRHPAGRAEPPPGKRHIREAGHGGGHPAAVHRPRLDATDKTQQSLTQ
jgi:hypothetical protein